MLLWLVRFLPSPPLPLHEVFTAANLCHSVRNRCIREALSAQLVPNYRPRIGHQITKSKNAIWLEKLSAQLVPSYAAQIFEILASAERPEKAPAMSELERRFRCDVCDETANYRFVSEPSPTPRTIPDHAPPLMDKKEVADWLNVCSRTIDNWLLEGWMPVIQLSPRIQRFNPLHILEAIEELYGKGHGYQKPQRRETLNVA